MIEIKIKTDFKDLQKRLNSLSKDIQKKVIPAALNKVIAKANTSMIREISSEFAISQAEVRENIRAIRARSVGGFFVATLDPNLKKRRGRGFNMIRFIEKTKSGTRKGLIKDRKRSKAGTLSEYYFQIKRSGGKKTVTGAFVGNRGRTVFIRTGKERLPIKALTTIDVPQMFNTRRINSKVIARINSEMVVEFERAINLQLMKASR